jgi:hypothetical protein
MLLHSFPSRVARAALPLAISLLVAAPALAVDYYRWTTEDGVVSYTDTAKRIPAMYKKGATRHASGSLRGYKLYTPIRRAAQADYAKRLEARLDSLRATRAPAEGAVMLPVAFGAPSRTHVRVRVPNLEIDVPGAGVDDEAVVVEEVQTRPRGSSTTRTLQVIRQGDRVLSVIKPLHHERDVSFLPDESELP